MEVSAESYQSTESEVFIPVSDYERVEKPSKWVRFGPTHGEDTEVNQIANAAWQHIMEISGAGSEREYRRSIKSIQEEAMGSYGSRTAEMLRRAPRKFVKMMAKDGCLFLQLALHILGAGNLLGYPQQHPYFGEHSDTSSYIPAMFLVGNQIPYVVINALMEQAYFKNVIAEGMENDTWERLRNEAGEDLVKLALYQVVVEPQLKSTKERDDEPPPSPPSDVLQALRILFLGYRHKDLNPHEIRESRDLETGRMSIRDDRFPCAGKLRASGIKFKKGESGITNIKFKYFGYSAYLYLPPLTVDSHTESLLTSLLRYEKMLHESEREVTAYLCLMKDLIPSYEDFSILERQGIIRLKDVRTEPTIRWLHNERFLDDSKLTPAFSAMRRKIREYEVVPWRLTSFVCSAACGIITFIIAVLTVVQIVIAVLSINHPRK